MLTANTALVRCDALTFETNLRAGQWLEATMAYGGAFLQGLEVKADTRFEHWRDGVDARLVAGYRVCVERLISSSESQDPSIVESWTRQAMLVLGPDARLATVHYRALAELGRPEEAGHGLLHFLSQHQNELASAERTDLAVRAKEYLSAGLQAGGHIETPRPSFVGRTSELVRLRETWTEVTHSAAAAVLLVGDPGIGKTRLIDQVARFAAIRGARVFLAGASPATARVPFSLIGDLFPQLESPRSALQRLHVSTSPRRVWEPLEAAFYAECEQLLRKISADHPILVAVDDLQWVDESSLRLLTYLAHRCHNEPVLLVLGVRPEGEQLRDRFMAVVKTSIIRVGPLPEAAAESLLATHFSSHPAFVGREEKKALIGRAGGNPFFLIALAEDSLRQAGAPNANVQSSVPESISALVMSRVRQVSTVAQDTIRTAAILRSEESIDVIARIGRRSPLRTARAVEELVRMALVVDGPGGVAIAHDVIADAVYNSIPGSIRRYLHRRAALSLTDRGAAVVANHASRARDWELAYPAAMRAAQAAERVGAYSDADYFQGIARSSATTTEQRAEAAAAYVSFVCGLDRFSSALDHVALARLHFSRVGDEAGLLRCSAVELDAAINGDARPLRELTQEAMHLVKRTQEVGASWLAPEMLSVLYRAVELGSMDGSAADWVKGAIDVAEGAERKWQVTLLGKAAVLSYFAVGEDQARALAIRLPEMAGDDVRLRALAYGYVGVTYMLLGRLHEAERYYQDAVRLARDPALADAYYKASMNLAVLETDMGRYQEARARLTEAAGMRATLVSVANTGFLCIESGELDGAEKAAAQIRRRSTTLAAPMAIAAAATLEGLVAWTREDYAKAELKAREVAPLLEEIPFQSDDSYARMLMARSIGRDDPKRALQLLDEPQRRAAVPQLRVDLERAVQLSRIDRSAGKLAVARVLEAADVIGATPIAVRAAAALE